MKAGGNNAVSLPEEERERGRGWRRTRGGKKNKGPASGGKLI